MKKTYKYPKIDKQARRITTAVFVVLILGIAAVWYFIGLGGYFVAWALSLTVAVIALFIISIPRSLVIEEGALEIRCAVELTRISFSDLAGVRQVERGELRRYVPCFGSYGFFGYFGYYVSLRSWDTIRIYCTRRENFVEITDIYEKRYLVNCEEPEEFVASLTRSCGLYTETDN